MGISGFRHQEDRKCSARNWRRASSFRHQPGALSFSYSFITFSTCSCWPPSWEMVAPQSLHATRS